LLVTLTYSLNIPLSLSIFSMCTLDLLPTAGGVRVLDWRGGDVGHLSGLVAPSEEPCLIDIPRYVFVLEIGEDRARVSIFQNPMFI
jgi:hypothetical protein